MRLHARNAPPIPVAVLVLLGAICLATLAYVVHLTAGLGPLGAGWYDRWLADVVIGLSAGACFARAVLVRADRGAWTAFGIALTLYLFGDAYWNLALADLDAPPYPSFADAGWIAYYLPAYIGIALLLRARMGRMLVSEWLDGLVAALALAALAAVTVFDPLLSVTGGDAATIATNLAYPVGDLALLVFSLCAIAFLGGRPGRAWLLLVGGLAAFAVVDSLYLLQTADGTYAEGTLLDAGWPLAACLLAIAAWQPMPAQRGRVAGPVTEQAIVGGFALLALAVLAVGLVTPLNAAGNALAVAAMAVIVARLVIAAQESRSIERARERQSRTDELTGLANRRGFYAQLERELALVEDTAEPVALLLMDLDHFKEFNDSLGHSAGDQLLQEVAARLPQTLGPDAFVARLGGDEFVVLLPLGMGRRQARGAAAEIREALVAPVELEGIACHASVSIGIAVAPDHGEDRTTLLRRADIAMYRAKKHATGVELFDDAGGEISRGDIELAGELRHAVEHGGLVLHYQPKARLDGGTVESVEALVRWQHPRLGLLAPDAFLPVGERHGLMRELTRAVLGLALAQQAAWREEGIDLGVAVNLSGADLLDVRFPAEVAGMLERFATPAGKLQFEITENIVMIDPSRVIDTLERLGDLGICFSLDDYGTGHSSLAHLKRLPVSELKIDRSFVIDMQPGSENAVIVRSTIDLARNLGMNVVAEGVETREHWRQLGDFGCDSAQGYYLSRPLPAQALAVWLRAGGGELAA